MGRIKIVRAPIRACVAADASKGGASPSAAATQVSDAGLRARSLARDQALRDWHCAEIASAATGAPTPDQGWNARLRLAPSRLQPCCWPADDIKPRRSGNLAVLDAARADTSAGQDRRSPKCRFVRLPHAGCSLQPSLAGRAHRVRYCPAATASGWPRDARECARRRGERPRR